MTLPARVDPAVTPAQADAWEREALDAIESVDDLGTAESLLARVKVVEQALRLARLSADRQTRWGRVKLLAERRYGELLGPAETGRPEGNVSTTNVSDGADRVAKHEARKVASVPPPVFQGYVGEAEKPTRAGLLREADKMAVHYSSATDEWSTPQDFFDAVAREFAFDLDVCALDSSAKCARYFTPDTDGLAQEWAGTCWMNPPYGSAIAAWVSKAHEASEQGATVVCLLPARVDTGWWWDHCRYAEIRFLRGRLRFGGSDTGAPFPSAIVVFGRPARVVWWEWAS